MINFYETLKIGTNKQQKAYLAIEGLHIMNDLSEYNPILCGTVPIGIDVNNSDLDIIMEVHNFKTFENRIVKLYGEKINFRIKRKEIRGRQVVKANFFYMGFEFELFGQAQPVQKQYAYLHMVIEHVLIEKNSSLREKVITLKQQGYKTEPAFCKVLGIDGDPYEGLLRYAFDKGIVVNGKENLK